MQTPGFSAEAAFQPARAVARQSGDGRSWEWCECRGGCRVVKMCLLNDCFTTTVCSDCAYVHNCRRMTR